MKSIKVNTKLILILSAAASITGIAGAQSLVVNDHWILTSSNHLGTSYNVSVNSTNSGIYAPNGRNDGDTANQVHNISFGGPIEDYAFYEQDGTNSIGFFANGSAGRISNLTPDAVEGTGGNEKWRNLWTTTDPTADFSVSPDFSGSNVLKAAGVVTGTTQINGLTSGSLFFLYGSFNTTPTINISMSGPGQSTINLMGVGNQDAAQSNQMYALQVDFADAENYDTISYEIIPHIDIAARGRIDGIILSNVAVPEPSTAVFLSLAGICLLLRRRRS